MSCDETSLLYTHVIVIWTSLLYLITELYKRQLSGKRVVLCITKGQLSGKRVVLCIAKAVKRSLQIWCLETTYVHLPGMLFMILELPSKLVLVGGGKKARENNSCTACYGFFCHSAWVVATTMLVTNEVI